MEVKEIFLDCNMIDIFVGYPDVLNQLINEGYSLCIDEYLSSELNCLIEHQDNSEEKFKKEELAREYISKAKKHQYFGFFHQDKSKNNCVCFNKGFFSTKEQSEFIFKQTNKGCGVTTSNKEIDNPKRKTGVPKNSTDIYLASYAKDTFVITNNTNEKHWEELNIEEFPYLIPWTVSKKSKILRKPLKPIFEENGFNLPESLKKYLDLYINN